MLLSRFAIVVTLAVIALAFSRMPCALAQETDTPPPSCHVTLTAEGNFFSSSPVLATHAGTGADGMVIRYGTDRFWTLLPTDGIWRGRVPSKPGDFAYDNKLPWFRMPFSEKDGLLTVTGRRLDGPTLSFTETEESRFFPDGAMIMGGISIPVFGCWEITGHFKDQDLIFVVWVAPVPERESSSSVSSLQTVEDRTTLRPQPRRILVDGEVEAEELVYRLTPEIPHEAEVAHVSGTVVLHAIIGEDGRAHDLHYVSGPLLLTQAAINAVSWWQYRVTGESQEVDTTIDVRFPPANN